MVNTLNGKAMYFKFIKELSFGFCCRVWRRRYVCNVLLNNVLLNVLEVLSMLKSLNNANVNRQPNPKPKPRSSVGVN